MLNDVFVQLDDYSALDGILQAEDNIFDLLNLLRGELAGFVPKP